MSQETPQFSKQESKAMPKPEVSMPVPDLLLANQDLMQSVVHLLEQADTQTEGRIAFNRAALLDGLLKTYKEGLPPFEIRMQAWELGKTVVEAKREQLADAEDAEKKLWIEMLPIIEALNKEFIKAKTTVFMPVAGSLFSSLDMTGGEKGQTIQKVLSLGVKNQSGDTERKAIVR